MVICHIFQCVNHAHFTLLSLITYSGCNNNNNNNNNEAPFEAPKVQPLVLLTIQELAKLLNHSHPNQVSVQLCNENGRCKCCLHKRSLTYKGHSLIVKCLTPIQALDLLLSIKQGNCNC